MELASKNNPDEDLHELMNKILFEFEEFKSAVKSFRSSDSETEKEEKNKTVAVRTSDGKVKFGVKVDDLIKKILDNVEKKEEKFVI